MKNSHNRPGDLDPGLVKTIGRPLSELVYALCAYTIWIHYRYFFLNWSVLRFPWKLVYTLPLLVPLGRTAKSHNISANWYFWNEEFPQKTVKHKSLLYKIWEKTSTQSKKFHKIINYADFLFLLLFSLLNFHQLFNFQKYPEICGNKHIFNMFCNVYVSKFPHSLKLSANGICAICHFLQVCL